VSFFEVLRIVLRVLSVGPPPPIEQEAELRAWVRSVFEMADELADMSATPVDDQLVQVALKLVNDDEIWSLAYQMLVAIVTDDDNKVGASFNQLTSKAGIDPLTIMALIKMIAEIIQQFRRR